MKQAGQTISQRLSAVASSVPAGFFAVAGYRIKEKAKTMVKDIIQKIETLWTNIAFASDRDWEFGVVAMWQFEADAMERQLTHVFGIYEKDGAWIDPQGWID